MTVRLPFISAMPEIARQSDTPKASLVRGKVTHRNEIVVAARTCTVHIEWMHRWQSVA